MLIGRRTIISGLLIFLYAVADNVARIFFVILLQHYKSRAGFLVVEILPGRRWREVLSRGGLGIRA